MSLWTFELRNRSTLETISLLQPSSATIHRRLNDSSWMQATVREGQAGAGEVTIGECVVFAFENVDPTDGATPAALRFAGQIMGDAITGSRDGGEVVQITAFDPFEGLKTTVAQQEITNSAKTQEQIIESVIVWANLEGKGTTHLAYQTTTTGYSPATPRDRTYPPGKNLGEAVQQLAAIDGGVWFTCDAVTPAPGPTDAFGQLNLRFPESGTDRPGVRFEFGEGTLTNVAQVDVQREIGGDVAPTRCTVTYGPDQSTVLNYPSTPNHSSYGRFDRHVSLQDVAAYDGPRALEETIGTVVGEPVRTYRMEPARGDKTPRLFQDFDVGDLVRVNLAGRLPQLQWAGTARVTQASMTIDENGSSHLSVLETEEVA